MPDEGIAFDEIDCPICGKKCYSVMEDGIGSLVDISEDEHGYKHYIQHLHTQKEVDEFYGTD